MWERLYPGCYSFISALWEKRQHPYLLRLIWKRHTWGLSTRSERIWWHVKGSPQLTLFFSFFFWSAAPFWPNVWSIACICCLNALSQKCQRFDQPESIFFWICKHKYAGFCITSPPELQKNPEFAASICDINKACLTSAALCARGDLGWVQAGMWAPRRSENSVC